MPDPTVSRANLNSPDTAVEMRHAAERYRAFIANSTEGIWRCELDQPIPIDLSPEELVDHAYRYGYLAECNDAMARMYGFGNAEDLVGIRLDRLLVREDPNNQAYLKAFVTSGFRLVDAESHEVDKLGRDKYFLNNLIGVIEDGRLVRAWGTQRDITDQKQIEEKLRRAAEAAEASNRAKTHFLSILSHELRTPLTPILLMVTMLEQKPDLPADLREDLAMIRENVQLEARLIDDLLDISRITRGKLKLEPSDVDVAPLVAAAIDAARSEDYAAITLDPAATRTVVHGDPQRLQQILRSLLSNATKFTPRRGQITVRTRNLDEQTLAIDVIDTGIGIEADQTELIFDAFGSGDPAARRQHGGLGLGLSISRWLARAHQGDLTAASEGKNRGATFTLTLPLKRE